MQATIYKVYSLCHWLGTMAHMPEIPALRGGAAKGSEYKVILGYTASGTPA